MDNTVCEGCTRKKCPNKIESFWKNSDGSVKAVVDCAPKRTILMLQELTNRQIANQAAMETMRNELDCFNGQIRALWQSSRSRNHELNHDAATALPDSEL